MIEEAHEGRLRHPLRRRHPQVLLQRGRREIGLKLGAEDFDHWIRAFGFGAPTGVEFPGEEQGIVIPA